ncbi:hypothetical protein DFJ73DRAFT_792681 [Zopfochytrium polystomum]|nr:hypothetical protein DFJ73DRAFT_792681 [Zopfochytrium polystomum]
MSTNASTTTTKPPPRKILVVGCGSIGAVYYEALLDASPTAAAAAADNDGRPFEVHLLVRPGRLSKLAATDRTLTLSRIPAPYRVVLRPPATTRQLHVPADRLHSTADLLAESLCTVPADTEAILITTSSLGLRDDDGAWIAALSRRCPDALFVSFTPGPHDIDFIRSKLATPASLAHGLITVVAWTPPLPHESFDPLAGAVGAAAAGKQPNHTAYFAALPQVFQYIPDASEAAAASAGELRRRSAFDAVVAAFRRGGLGAAVKGPPSASAGEKKKKKRTEKDDAGFDVEGEMFGFAFAIPLLVALETSGWKMRRLALNRGKLLTSALAATREIFETSPTLQRRRPSGWQLAFVILPLARVLLPLALLAAPAALRHLVDLDAMLESHFSKVGGQTRLELDQHVEAVEAAAAAAGGAGGKTAKTAAVRALAARCPRWGGPGIGAETAAERAEDFAWIAGGLLSALAVAVAVVVAAVGAIRG